MSLHSTERRDAAGFCAVEESGFTHPWVGQAEHLACRKRQPGAFAGAARTHSGKGGRHHRKASVAAVSALCAAFREGKGKHTGVADFRGCFFYMRKMLPKKPPGRMLT